MILERLPLRLKLLSLVLVTTLLLGGMSVAVIERIGDTVAEKELQSFQSYSLSLARAIESQFFERYGDVQAFAENPVLRSGQRNQITPFLNRMVALYGIYDLLIVADEEGRLVAANSKSPDGKDLDTAFLSDEDFSERPWFKAVREQKTSDDPKKGLHGTYFEDLSTDPLIARAYGAQKLSGSFSAAIRDPAGRLIGILSARTNSRWFEGPVHEAFQNLKSLGMHTSDVVLTGRDGTLLFEYTSDPANPGLDPSRFDFKQLLSYNFAKDGFEAAQKLSKGESGAGIYFDPREQEPHTTGFTALKGAKILDSIGWGVMVRNSTRYSEGLAELTTLRTRFYWTFGTLIVLAILSAVFLSRSIVRGISNLASRLAHGSVEVASAAKGISDSSQKLSSSVTEQAASLQETAAALEEITSMLKGSSENAERSREASQKSHELSRDSKESMDQLIVAMNEINQGTDKILSRVEEGNHRITEIVALIQEIGSKTKIINDIVFQTKLLSFNASVEAARAGEHGKGFAVVAEEVGNLAQMSGNAAKEISTLLESSTQRVEEIVRETRSRVEQEARSGKEKVTRGTEVATACRDLLEQILEGSGSVHAMVSEISNATREQTRGIDEINRAIAQLDQSTQLNSGVAQSGASAATQLTREADGLDGLVKELIRMVNGDGDPTPKESRSEPPEAAWAVSMPVKAAPPKEPAIRAETAKPKPAPAVKKAPARSIDPDLGVPKADDPRFEDL